MFDPQLYVPRWLAAAYDGTNSADILAYPWAQPLTLASESGGILAVYCAGDRYEIPTGAYVLVVRDNQFGGWIVAADLATRVHVTPATDT